MTPHGDVDEQPDGWRSAAEELAIYERLRLGEEDAFRLLATPLQPTLRRLVGLHVSDARAVDAVVLRSWRTVLHGDHMFRWQTPLATWIAGIAVTGARSHGVSRRTLPTMTPTGAGRPLPGPPDWVDLPWSGRWQGVGPRLDAALAALPVADLEVLHGRDVEGWPVRRVCDVFGLTEAGYGRRLVAARRCVHRRIAIHVGQHDPGPHAEAQIAAVTRWLGEHHAAHLDRHGPGLDPRTVEVFRRWAASRDRRWPRLVRHLRSVRRSEGPAARRGGPGSASASGRPTPR